jgi:hypothetical protein
MPISEFVANNNGLDGLQRVFLDEGNKAPHPVYMPSTGPDSSGPRPNKRALKIKLSDTTMAELFHIHIWGSHRSHTVMSKSVWVEGADNRLPGTCR